MMSLNKKALIRSHCPPLFHEASIGGALSLRKRSHSNLDIQLYDPGWACGEFGASFFMLSSFEFVCFVEYAPISFTVEDTFAPHDVSSSQYGTQCLL